jgi:hypothetical protein
VEFLGQSLFGFGQFAGEQQSVGFFRFRSVLRSTLNRPCDPAETARGENDESKGPVQ